jgi:hypothetical protein
MSSEEAMNRLEAQRRVSKSNLDYYIPIAAKSAAKAQGQESEAAVSVLEGRIRRLIDQPGDPVVRGVSSGTNYTSSAIWDLHMAWKKDGLGKIHDRIHRSFYHLANIQLEEGNATIADPRRMTSSHLMDRVIKLDHGKAKPYWSTPREMFARCFEAWVEDSLRREGIANPFLVHSTYKTGSANDLGSWYGAYPQGDERDRTNQAMGSLMAAVRPVLLARSQAATTSPAT